MILSRSHGDIKIYLNNARLLILRRDKVEVRLYPGISMEKGGFLFLKGASRSRVPDVVRPTQIASDELLTDVGGG